MKFFKNMQFSDELEKVSYQMAVLVQNAHRNIFERTFYYSHGWLRTKSEKVTSVLSFVKVFWIILTPDLDELGGYAFF